MLPTTQIRNILGIFVNTYGVRVYSDKRRGGGRIVRFWGLNVPSEHTAEIEARLRKALGRNFVWCHNNNFKEVPNFSVRLNDPEVWKFGDVKVKVLGHYHYSPDRYWVRFLTDCNLPTLKARAGEVRGGFWLQGFYKFEQVK